MERAQALALYETLGRDGLWAAAEDVENFVGTAEFCTAWAGQGPQAQAMRRELDALCPPRFLLPAAFAPGRAGAGATVLRALGGGAAALAVKPGAQALEPFFAAGYLLRRIRPLFALRPHYLFLLPGVQTAEKCRIMIPVSDTHEIALRLENGFVGVGVHRQAGQLLLCLAEESGGT